MATLMAAFSTPRSCPPPGTYGAGTGKEACSSSSVSSEDEKALSRFERRVAERIESHMTSVVHAAEVRLSKQMADQIQHLKESIQHQLSSHGGSGAPSSSSTSSPSIEHHEPRTGSEYASDSFSRGNSLVDTGSFSRMRTNVRRGSVSSLCRVSSRPAVADDRRTAQHTPTMVWSLVESDAKAMSMLNDVRKAIEGNADRNERLLDERLGSAKEGTKAFRAGRQASSTQLFAPGAPVALDAGPSKGPAAVLAQAARRPWREVRNERAASTSSSRSTLTLSLTLTLTPTLTLTRTRTRTVTRTLGA